VLVVACTNTYIGVTQVARRRWGEGTNLVVSAQVSGTAELVQEAPTDELLERVFSQNPGAVCELREPLRPLGGRGAVVEDVVGNWLVCWSKNVDVVKPGPKTHI